MGYMNQMEVDPYINDITDCPDDISSGSEDKVSPPVRCWRTMIEMSMESPSEIYHYRWEDNLDNELFHDMGPNSCGYTRYEYPYLSTTNIDSHQLLAALDSVVSSIENNIHVSHAINCVKCAQSKNCYKLEILADSGASLNFTNQRSNLSEYEEVEVQSVEMASAHSSLQAIGKGAMFISTSVLSKGKETDQIICLYPVFYIKGLIHRYLSVGTLLNQGLELRGSLSELQFRNHKQNQLSLMNWARPFTG